MSEITIDGGRITIGAPVVITDPPSLARSSLFETPATTGGYDADPNDVGAPDQLKNAAPGTWYLRETPSDTIYRKLTAAADSWLVTLPSSDGIGGTVGTTDNAIVRADGITGEIAQGSLCTIDDSGNLLAPAAATIATASGLRLGVGTTSSATGAAGGDGAAAGGLRATAFGPNASASGSESVAGGDGAQASGIGAVSIGDAATATQQGAIAHGDEATATGIRALAIGFDPTASANQAIAAGDGAQAVGVSSIATGRSSYAAGLRAIAHGDLANATPDQSVAIGYSTLIGASADSSVALGDDAAVSVGATNATALGPSASVTGASGLAAGFGAIAGADAVALGRGVQASATDAVGVGPGVFATANGSVSIGNVSKALQAGAAAYGESAIANGADGIAIGPDTNTDTGARGTGVGAGARCRGTDSSAFGSNTEIQSGHERATVLGTNAVSQGSQTCTIGEIENATYAVKTHLSDDLIVHGGSGARGSFAALRFASQTLSGLTGASAVTSGLIPAGATVMEVITRVDTLVTGPTTFEVGDGSDQNRWGTDNGFTVGSITDGRDWTDTAVKKNTAAQEVTLTAVGGNFTAGAVTIGVYYIEGQAMTA